MLRMLRSGGVSQWLMGGIVVAIIVVFMVPAMSGSQGGSLSVEYAVKVRGKSVPVKDYQAAYGLIMASQNLTPKKAKGLGIPQAALDGLVERELLLNEADRLGIRVSEDALNDELKNGRIHVSVPVEQHGYLARYIGIGEDMVRYLPVKNRKTGEFDMKEYERMIRNVAGRSAGQFREMQLDELRANRVRDLVKSRVRVSPEELWFEYQREKARATARTVSVQKAWVARFAVDTSDKAVEGWMKDNQASVDEKWEQAKGEWVAKCPVVREIVSAFPEGASDDEKATAKTQLEGWLENLKQPGANFSDLAREYSMGASAPVGGLLGCLSEKYGPGSKVLLAAVEGMKAGDVSPVLETPKGYVVIKLDRRLAEADVVKVGKRELARALMAVDVTEKRTKEIADKLLEAAKGGEALGEAADRIAAEYALGNKKLKEGEESKALTDPNRPKLNITAAFAQGSRPLRDATEDIADLAFKLDKPDTVHPNLIKLQGGFAVLQLKEKTLPTKEDLEKERFEYSERMRQAKEQEALRIYIQRLKKNAEGLIDENKALIASDKQDEKDEG
ncbi:MAG: SurA N-terminal domain-containing protein [Polyangiaceae bacterium]|nr:SurA N-terminal domain-containing protein [Polyangiaceae bacterium]